MSATIGTVIGAQIVPTDTTDNYGTHEDVYCKGGYHPVDSWAERNSIPRGRLKVGMLVRTANDGKMWTLDAGYHNPVVDGDWTEFAGSGAEGYITIVTSDRTYYTDPTDGDNSNDGLSALAPKKNISQVISVLEDSVSANITINVASGTDDSEVYISKLHNLSGSTKSLTIQGERITVIANFTPTAVLDGIVRVSGAGWSVDAYKGMFLYAVSGMGAGTKLPITSNTATDLHHPLVYTGDVFPFNTSTHFIVYSLGTTISTDGVAFTSISCQKSLQIKVYDCIIQSSGASATYDTDSVVIYDGCDIRYNGYAQQLSLSTSSFCYMYSCILNGSSLATSGHYMSTYSQVTHSYCFFRNFGGASNRQALYNVSSEHNSYYCAWENNYVHLRCFSNGRSTINTADIMSNATYALYAQRGGEIVALTAQGTNDYAARVAESGKITVTEILWTNNIKLFYIDSPLTFVLDNQNKIAYKKETLPTVSKSSDYTIPADMSGEIFTNSANMTYTLPSIINRTHLTFIVGTSNEAQYLKIQCTAGTKITYLGVSCALEGYMRANTKGTIMELFGVSDTEWILRATGEVLYDE